MEMLTPEHQNSVGNFGLHRRDALFFYHKDQLFSASYEIHVFYSQKPREALNLSVTEERY
jgi:hypothetical protein